jgi:electron transport complex protein RnfE
MDKQKYKEALLGGIVSNPVFVLVIGMCPVIAQSNTIQKAFALGVATAVVLILSNVLISVLRKVIPNTVRIPVFIVIIATMTTLLIMIMQSYLNDLYNTIAPFLSLVAVNCVVMARVEVFSSKNDPLSTLIDSSSMGIGFVLAITLLGCVRQLLSTIGFAIFDVAAGGFLALGLLIVLYVGIVNLVKRVTNKTKVDMPSPTVNSVVDNA